MGAPGRQSDRTGLLEFFVTKTCKLAETIIVNMFCHFSRSSPFFGPFSIIYEMNTENSWVILMMAWPEKFFFRGGGSKKCGFFRILGTI